MVRDFLLQISRKSLLRPIKLHPICTFTNTRFCSSAYPVSSSELQKRPYSISRAPFSRNFIIRKMSYSTSQSSVEKEIMIGDGAREAEIFEAVEDLYDGVTVKMDRKMDSEKFTLKLRASIENWRTKGKKGIWIRLPLEHANLVEAAVNEGFRYHHAEPDYLMLVNWIAETHDTIPANASHRVGVGALVLNDNKEVLVVQENSGLFKGRDVWKLPTGVVNEGEDICNAAIGEVKEETGGEDICDAAIREVKEETAVDTEFVEVLAFRQSHKAFFGKSDLFFVCMLAARSLKIQKQDTEIFAAKDYANQPFNQKTELFHYIADICIKKAEEGYSGFTPVPVTTASGKIACLYSNSHLMKSTNPN